MLCTVLYRLSYAAIATTGLEPAAPAPKGNKLLLCISMPCRTPKAADGVRTRDPPVKSRMP